MKKGSKIEMHKDNKPNVVFVTVMPTPVHTIHTQIVLSIQFSILRFNTSYKNLSSFSASVFSTCFSSSFSILPFINMNEKKINVVGGLLPMCSVPSATIELLFLLLIFVLQLLLLFAVDFSW